MFMTDRNYNIKQKTSQFYAAQMITQDWVQPKDAEHKLFTAASDIKDADGHILVTAYALLRPDGQWSLLLINKDHETPHSVRIVFHDAESKTDRSFEGPVDRITFGRAQYVWHSAGREGYADPDNPPLRSTVQGTEDSSYTLPAASLTVLRGTLSHR
jgi:hypothetical protein